MRSAAIVTFAWLVLVGSGLAGCLSDTTPGQGHVKLYQDTTSGADIAGVDVFGSCGACDDGNPCTHDQCNAATGTCEHLQLPDGTSCGACGAVCVAGQCDGGFGCADDADCDDGDVCTEDLCDVASCACANVPLPGCTEGCPTECYSDEPCTFGYCDLMLGQCVFAPFPDGAECGPCGAICIGGVCSIVAGEPPGPGMCSVDTDCNDGNVCTLDTCTDFCTCEHVWIPGCDDCGIKCDDGDPCTEDYCNEGVCVHDAIPGCGTIVPSCNSQGVVSVWEASYYTPGVKAKVAGVPVMAGTMSCGGSTNCDPADCTCVVCQGPMGVADGTGTMMVLTPDAGLPQWSCEGDQCGTLSSCSEPHHDSAYWMWGTLELSDLWGPGYLMAAAVNDLSVEGWCIQTTTAGLPGLYDGALEYLMVGESVLVTMTIQLSAGGLTVHLAPNGSCLSCEAQITEQYATDVWLGDGQFGFTAVATSASGVSQTMNFVLDSWHNTLSGPFGSFVAGGTPQPPPPVPIAMPEGAMSVTRVQQAPSSAP